MPPVTHDIPTLVRIAAITSMLLTAGMLIVRRVAPHEPGVREWTWAAFYSAVAYIAASLREALPLPVIPFAVGALLLSYVGFYRGARRFVGRPVPRALDVAAAALTIVVIAWQLVAEPSLPALVGVVSLTGSAVILATWLALLRPPAGVDRFVHVVVACVFLIWGLVFVATFVASATWAPTQPLLEGGGPLRGYGRMVHVAFHACLALGLPLLVMERLRARQVQAEAALRRHERELEALVAERTAVVERQSAEISDLYDNAPCGYHSIDAAGTIVAMNDAELRMLGYRRDEVVGRMNIRALIAPEQVAGFEERFPDFVRNGSSGDGEFEYLRKDGSRIPVVVHANAVRDASGRYLHSRTVVVDETERVRIRRALEDANADLERRVRERTERLREMSIDITLAEERERRALARDLHDDLGQTLHVAKIKLEALSRLLPAGEPASAIATDLDGLITDASARVRSVTAQLSPPVLERLGLAAALRWLAEEVERTYGLVVEVDDDDRPKPLTQAQSVILFRAARELLINVARHSDSSIARVELELVDGVLELRVVDEGVGFEGSATADERGGFGLASVRERVEHLHGTIAIDSVPDEGTTVRLRVPLYAANDEERK